MRKLFAYGSLVNIQTLGVPFHSIKPASVYGFQRSWCQAAIWSGQRFSALGIRDGGHDAHVNGALLTIDDTDWHYFIDREVGYEHRIVTTINANGDEEEGHTFLSPTNGKASPPPILLSYCLTVMRGFHELGSIQDVGRFVELTNLWAHDLVND
ncbi:MAG: gamma-glutamylcyclotransferase family protein, partial [Pseudomonadota bacterium]